MNRRVLFTLTAALISFTASPLGRAVARADQLVATAAKITGIQMMGSTVIVSALVPAGPKKIVLQSSRRLGTGAWEPRAVLRVDGQGGEVVFRVNRSRDLEIVRLRADDTDSLPTSFFQGTNAFPGTVVSPMTAPGAVDFNTAGGMAGAVDNRSVDAAPVNRDVVESDIWQIDGNVLYFFNQYRGLQVIDLAQPDAPVVRGTYSLPAVGEQMYLLPGGHVVLLAGNGCGWAGDSASQVLVLNVAGTIPTVESSMPLGGQIQESRLVGSALYVLTQSYRPVLDSKEGAWEWGTSVSSFDLSSPAAPLSRSTLWFVGYGNVLSATDHALLISVNNGEKGSQVHYIDITSPDGTMQAAGSVGVAGNVTDKFKMQLQAEILTVISERWSWEFPNQTGRWRPVTTLETFSFFDPAKPQKLGELELANGEQLHATRFDGNRVYVVTFLQVDPLWVVDLSDPTRPAIRGELHIPGWSTYIQPYGDRLVTIGIDSTNGWRVAVSLFDVHDSAAPTLLSKVPLGENSSWSEANYDEKAFGFLPNAGLILVPFSTYSTNQQDGVQLIDFSQNTLVKRGFIPHAMQARRSTVHESRILSISGRELLSVDASDRDKPIVRSETPLAWGVDRVFAQGEYLIELEAASAWSANTQPALRVVPMGKTEQVLNVLPLVNLPVVGASFRGGRLYLLQGNPVASGIIFFANDQNGSDAGTQGVTNTARLVCSVVDATKLPQIQVLSAIELFASEGFDGSAVPLWVKPELLVWATQQANYWPWWRMPGTLDMVAGPNSMIARGGFGYRFSGSTRSQLLAVDVADPLAPKFVSEVNIKSTNGWASFSKPFVADNSVFLGRQITETSITGTNYFLSTNIVSVTNEQPIYVSRQLSYLDVVDYTAPANPVVRAPVTVPGALQGVARQGALVYLLGPALSNVGLEDGREWLHACAYDGVACYLVDSHPLAEQWPHPVLGHASDVFIGRPEVDKGAGRGLEIWTINDAGKFTKVNEQPVQSNLSALQLVGDLLVGQEDAGLEVFSLQQPSLAPRVGAGEPSGCLGWTLENAAGSHQDGLWLPLGLYGVEEIELKP